MSFATKYRSEFKDRLGLLWRVDIEEDGFGGAITNLKPTGTPLNFEFLSNSDNIFEDPVHGSVATIGIYSETDFAWTSLYNYGNLVYRVSIYYGVSYTLYWRGFINSEGYEEPYDGVAYPVSLSASDGLGMLKDMLYKYETYAPDDTYYNGRRFASQIIIDVLAKINITGFTEFINIYDTGMDDAVTDSPFDQYKIDVDVFKDMYCYEVLEEILKKYNACIRQVAGAMVIYRPADLTTAAVYGRIFTTATAHTGTTLTPDQYIDRKTAVTDHRFPDGGNMMILPPAKKVTLTQDYGYKESWIDNHKFKPDTYDGSTFDQWIKFTTNTILPVSNKVPNEETGVIIIGSSANTGMVQIFGNLAIPTTDIFVIEFEWLRYFSASKIGPLTVNVMQIGAGSYYLYEIDSEYCGWRTTASYITVTIDELTISAGASQWTKFSRKIVGIPTFGQYYVNIVNGLSATSTTSGIGVKDLKFYSTSDNITNKRTKKKLAGETLSKWQTRVPLKILALIKYEDEEEIVDYSYEMLNTIKGIDIENDYLLGDVPDTSSPASDRDTNIDNVVEQFAGSLCLYHFMSLPDVAEAFVVNHAVDYLPAVIVTQGTGINTKDIIFTGAVGGTPFSGTTGISNVVTNLSGTMTNVQPSTANTPKIVELDLSGSSGTIDITVRTVTRTMSFYGSDISDTIDNFISVYGGNYTPDVLTRAGTTRLKITGDGSSGDFSYGYDENGITVTSDNVTQDFAYGDVQIDKITLSGATGTANILCNGVTKLAEVLETNDLTTVWHKGPTGTEDKPLLELIGDELALQHSLPQQFLSLPVIEKGVNSINPLIKVVGNFQDPLNMIGGYKKIFAINGGVFDVKNREWEIDMNEILMFRLPAIIIYAINEDLTVSSYSGSLALNGTTLSYAFTVDYTGEIASIVYKNGVVMPLLNFTCEVVSGVEYSSSLTVDPGQYNDLYNIGLYIL